MKSFHFEGKGFEYFKIWIVNILLVIITSGLYYPWAKVRNLRYFYGNAILENRRFDYHATGKQLFMGYLIALGLLIVYVVIEQISPVGGLIVLGVLFFAIPWIIWRSLMFNMRMTSFSNVRFSFDGRLGQSYINFFVLPFLLLLFVYGIPFGLLMYVSMSAFSNYADMASQLENGGQLDTLPATVEAGPGPLLITAALIGIVASLAFAIYLFGLIKKRKSMYLINGTQYGQGRFSTELESKVFVKILLKTIGLSFLMFFAFSAFVGLITSFTMGLGAFQQTMDSLGDPSGFADLIASGAIFMVLSLYLGLIFLGFLIAAYSYTRQRNYTVNNTMLDNKIALASTLKARSFALVMTTNLLLIMVTLGFGTPWAKVRMARFVLENTHVDTEASLDDYVTQQQEHQSSLGDQIGDAFDVDVGLAI